MKTLHQCPAPGCLTRIQSHEAFCRSHWQVLPSPLKKAILEAWRNQGPMSEAHVAAMDAAIKSLSGRATPPTPPNLRPLPSGV